MVMSEASRAMTRLLVVEDEEGVRELMAAMLRQLGYTVFTAATPAEAIRLAEEHRDALGMVLTDVVMPQMSGRELANELLRANPELKVLFLSGYTENAVVHHGVLDSGVDFLAKPFSQDALARKVRGILDKPSGRRPA